MGMRLGNLGLVLLVTSGIAWAEQDSHELGQISVTAGGYAQQVEEKLSMLSCLKDL